MSEKDNNVLGEPLEICGEKPLTGYFRDGSCRTDKNDYGSHTVCAFVTEEFLEFSKSRGNDLKTPRPDLNFQGLKEGDSWCLCANRWLEAYQSGAAPKIKLRSTNIKALDVISLDILKANAVDIS
tara:strand:- start:837 stop:1211 length:375 start_codon:yes stop_codon:yes gene_type:complete